MGKGIVDQEHCSECGEEFDYEELVAYFGTMGPTYCYCACTRCKKAWEIGQLRHGTQEIERREVEYRVPTE